MANKDEFGLTPHEKRVYALIVNEGLEAEEIGERLRLSANTVKNTSSRILQKFGVDNRTKLAIQFWMRRRLQAALDGFTKVAA